MTVSSLTTGLAAAVIALAGSAAGALAASPAGGHFGFPEGRSGRALPPRVELASADCNAAAERVVSRTGGQLLSVSAASQGGRTVCRVTVLVPASDHKRPRKVTVTVSQ